MTEIGQYWPVGASASVPLALTTAELSGYLVSDWVSNIPSVTAVDLMGWPQYLLTVAGATNELTLVPELRTCERQWKGFVSWMLGVALARKILDNEGYQWVAPASAFYANKLVPVSTHGWHPSYPPSRLRITADPQNPSNLQPDYVALRLSGSAGHFDWALAEAKGIDRPLKSMTTAPLPWFHQVRNAKVSALAPGATVGTPVQISRHMVIATRVSPNASRDTTRRLQIRAWNSEKAIPRQSASAAAFEVIAAHLHGLCQNVGLYENADAIARAARLRAAPSKMATDDDLLKILRDNATAELDARVRYLPTNHESRRRPRMFTLPERRDRRGVTNAIVTIEDSTIKLLEIVQNTYSADQIDMGDVQRLSRELDHLYLERLTNRGARDSVQRDGVTVSFQTTDT